MTSFRYNYNLTVCYPYTYQRQYPNYDRFLPYLAKYIAPSNGIADVGANVVDTLASMVAQNSLASYIYIEPDSSFFYFLIKI